MVKQAMRDLGFSPHEAVLIGDSDAGGGGRRDRSAGGGRGPSASSEAAHDFLEAACRTCALLRERGG
jgi:hypothetical protein